MSTSIPVSGFVAKVVMVGVGLWAVVDNEADKAEVGLTVNGAVVMVLAMLKMLLGSWRMNISSGNAVILIALRSLT